MKPFLLLPWFVACLLAASCSAAAASAPTEFLRLLFGATDVNVERVCVPHPDLWMLHGPRNDAGLAEIAQLKLEPAPDRVVWESVAGGMCIFELREGRVDARFLLDQVYFRHRNAVLQFLYQSLRQDREELARVTTDSRKVRFGKSRPATPGDLDVYEEAIVQLPVVRISSPVEDRASKSVTYLVPLGPRGLALRLVKRERAWLIDSSDGIDVPLEVFFEESKERRVVYPKQ